MTEILQELNPVKVHITHDDTKARKCERKTTFRTFSLTAGQAPICILARASSRVKATIIARNNFAGAGTAAFGWFAGSEADAQNANITSDWSLAAFINCQTTVYPIIIYGENEVWASADPTSTAALTVIVFAEYED